MKKEKKLVVYHINTVGNSGSTGRIVEGICKLAYKNNIKCYTAYGRWANTSISQLYKIGNKLSIYWHVLLTRLFDKHGLGSYKATVNLIKSISEIKPDIIHLHNIHGYYINYPILFDFLKSNNIPTVWTLHDCWSYTGHCVHYTIKKCDKWKKECFNCPNLRDYPKSWFIDASNYNYKKKKKYFTQLKNLTIITVSYWLANQVKESFLSKYPIIPIYNGVNTDIFSPQKINKSVYNLKNKFVILGVASVWDVRKGLHDFISLANLLDEDFIILLVGVSKQQINQLPSNIKAIERTENIKELANLYSISDVYINFSVEETFGLTTIESLACGTPVIVVNSTALPEIISDNIGFIIEPHDIYDAKRKIEAIKEKGKKIYSNNCRSYVIKNYKDTDRYQEYINLYKTLKND